MNLGDSYQADHDVLDQLQFDAPPTQQIINPVDITHPKYASDKSLAYMRSLARDRDTSSLVSTMPSAWLNVFRYVIGGNDIVAQSDVSKFIDALKKCPTREQVEASHHMDYIAERVTRKQQELTDGMYRSHRDIIYKVYHTQTGQQVAKRLVDDYPNGWKFKYEGKAPLHFLKPTERMSIDDAMEFGKIYGQCCMCGRTLTDELSIEMGIGPVCGKREFGETFTVISNAKKQELEL